MLWGLMGSLWLGMLICYIAYYKHGKPDRLLGGAIAQALLFMVAAMIAARGLKSGGAGAARYTYYINGIRIGSRFAAFSGKLIAVILIGVFGALVAAWTAKGIGYLLSRIGKKEEGSGLGGKALVAIGAVLLVLALAAAAVGVVLSGSLGPASMRYGRFLARLFGPGVMRYRGLGRTLTVAGLLPLAPGAVSFVYGILKLRADKA